jgi:hypothetical protein
MLDQLVFTVILHAAAVTSIGFVISVSTNVVVSVADSCEALVAVDTTVRFLSSVNPHVDNQVSTFIEALGTERTMECGRYVRCSAGSIEIFFLAVLFLKVLYVVFFEC